MCHSHYILLTWSLEITFLPGFLLTFHRKLTIAAKVD